MNTLEQALKKAMRHLAVSATNELRSGAAAHGWDPQTANGLSVELSATQAVVHVEDQFATSAFDNEFGNQNHSPKATIRKLNDSGVFEDQFAILIDHYISRGDDK